MHLRQPPLAVLGHRPLPRAARRASATCTGTCTTRRCTSRTRGSRARDRRDAQAARPARTAPGTTAATTAASSHDVKAVYQKYLGFFDGNPANLHPLPPVESGKKYVDLAGGADALLAKGREAYARGEYRWTAQLVNHLVFADPGNAAARELQADALEQLGYQSESGPWRNFYLTGAQELRSGVAKAATPSAASGDVVAAMSVDMLLGFLAVRLNGQRAADADIALTLVLTDAERALRRRGRQRRPQPHRRQGMPHGAQVTVSTTRAGLTALLAGGDAVQKATESGAVQLTGRRRQAARAARAARRVRVLVRHRHAVGRPPGAALASSAAIALTPGAEVDDGCAGRGARRIRPEGRPDSGAPQTGLRQSSTRPCAAP